MHRALFLASALSLVTHSGSHAAPALAASAWPDRYNDCLGIEDTDAAADACEDALTSPALSVLERAEVYRRLGAMYRWNEQLDEAKVNLDNSLALVPESPETLAEIGAVFFLTKDYEAANDSLSKAIAGGVLGGEVWNNRAMTLQALGDVKSAIRDFDAAIEISDQNGAIWNNRANMLCATGEVDGSYRDRIQALYNRRFTAAAAQSGLRNSGFYDGPSDGIWGFDSEQALYAWTEAGCPNAPASRLQ